MAYFSDIRSAGSNTGVQSLINRFADLRATLSTRLERHASYRRTFEELSNLSNRDLADLGIHRSNIRAIAMQSVYN